MLKIACNSIAGQVGVVANIRVYGVERLRTYKDQRLLVPIEGIINGITNDAEVAFQVLAFVIRPRALSVVDRRSPILSCRSGVILDVVLCGLISKGIRQAPRQCFDFDGRCRLASAGEHSGSVLAHAENIEHPIGNEGGDERLDVEATGDANMFVEINRHIVNRPASSTMVLRWPGILWLVRAAIPHPAVACR